MTDIPIFPQSIIYVACLRNHATGGPELLHQLVHTLVKQGYDARMLYYPKAPVSHDPIHPNYKVYQNRFVYEVADEKENLLIVPEICTELYQNKKHIRSAIWWLSVDFHYARYKKKKLQLKEFLGLTKFFRFEKPSTHPDYHLAQSHYAIDHLRKRGVQDVFYLSDYLNAKFFEPKPQQIRDSIVLYNPKKGAAFTKKIMSACAELQWQPIINMTPEQVSDLLRRRKVYIDFGNHPGKDRFPREAAISGCCIITGTEGAAAFDEDVPIPSEFKFEPKEVNIHRIIDCIKNCQQRFEEETQKFEHYRASIRQEEKLFSAAIVTIFRKV